MLTLGSAYLILYNLVLFAGWCSVLLTVFNSVNKCEEGGSDVVPSFIPFGHGQICVFGKVDGSALFTELKIWQTPALLEVLHCFGLVKSKVSTVLPQVMSRVGMVWWILWACPQITINTPEFWLMSFAWGVTEVVRYSWYALKELVGEAPFPLTWCRYTFFIALYPIGVYGELCTEYTAAFGIDTGAGRTNVIYKYFVFTIMAMYPLIFPMLYLHMFKQRKSAVGGKKKEKRAPRPDSGIIFPKQEDGTTSTSVTGAQVIGAALGAVDESKGAKATAAGKKWRFGYLKHLTEMVNETSKSKENCLKISQAGLDFLHENFMFVKPGTTDAPIPFVEEMASGKDTFNVARIDGEGKLPSEYVVPYKGKDISGTELAAVVDGWVNYGTIEGDCGEAIKDVLNNKKWQNLKGQVFVMIGAGSAMGPFLKLLELGATVVALDVPNTLVNPKHPVFKGNVWKYLTDIAKKSPGSIVFPVSKPQKECKNDEELFAAAGANLMEQPAEILSFLLKDTVCGKKPFTIGNYTYLDGALHVKLSLCSDAIMKGLIEKRGNDCSLAFLCTPTDLMPIPDAAMKAIEENRSFAKRPLGKPIEMLAQLLSGKPKKNGIKFAEGCGVDGISIAQGPNYALAKRLQHWRAMVAYDAGCKVSSNIAPSTATASVTSNITFKWAYGGMPYFTPFEIFQQETTNAVMAALLIHDINNSNGPSNPANREKFDTTNPFNLFKFGSFHGGLWRCGYSVNSIGELSVLIHFLGGPGMFLTVIYPVMAVLGYFFSSPTFLQSASVTGFAADVSTLIWG
jgi:hypothetical protein